MLASKDIVMMIYSLSPAAQHVLGPESFAVARNSGRHF